MTPEEPDDRTSHLAALCKGCSAAFVVATLPMEVGAAVKRMQRATCPDCGAGVKRLAIALGDNHARAVARLRRDAGLS